MPKSTVEFKFDEKQMSNLKGSINKLFKSVTVKSCEACFSKGKEFESQYFTDEQIEEYCLGKIAEILGQDHD